jgi:hypothetical protein
MKHFVFSKILFVAALMLLVSCEKHDEIAFTGTVIDTRECTPSYLQPDLGYVVRLDSPDSIGQPYIINGVTHKNCVILYDPDCRIYKNDKISGTFYLDDKYSRANCSIHWTDFQLPEGVFISVTVD